MATPSIAARAAHPPKRHGAAMLQRMIKVLSNNSFAVTRVRRRDFGTARADVRQAHTSPRGFACNRADSNSRRRQERLAELLHESLDGGLWVHRCASGLQQLGSPGQIYRCSRLDSRAVHWSHLGHLCDTREELQRRSSIELRSTPARACPGRRRKPPPAAAHRVRKWPAIAPPPPASRRRHRASRAATRCRLPQRRNSSSGW